MTYLELCQRYHLLARLGEDAPGTAPTAVTAQAGVLSEIVQHIALSYADILALHGYSWRFLTKRADLALVNGTATVDPSATIADYEEIKPSDAEGHARFILTYLVDESDETQVYYVPYAQWRQSFVDRGTPAEGRPYRFTVRDDGLLQFDPVPNDAYRIKFDYRRTANVLAANADEPLFAAKHHPTIVWWALENYYCTTRDGTNEFRAKCELQRKRGMKNLAREELPEVTTLDVVAL